MLYPLLSIDVALSLPNIMFNGSRDRYRHGDVLMLQFDDYRSLQYFVRRDFLSHFMN